MKIPNHRFFKISTFFTLTSLNLSIKSTAFRLKRSNVLKRNRHCAKLKATKRPFTEELSLVSLARRAPQKTPRQDAVPCSLAASKGSALACAPSPGGVQKTSSQTEAEFSKTQHAQQHFFPQKFLLFVLPAQLVRTTLWHGRPTVTAP